MDELDKASRNDTAGLGAVPFIDPSAGGRIRTPGVLVMRGAQSVFVDGTGAEHNVIGVSSWRQLHGEITGAPSPKHRDFWCGGTADSPTFYGSERFGSNETSVLRYGDAPAVRAPAAAAPRRARPR